jgi:hypothetical protein
MRVVNSTTDRAKQAYFESVRLYSCRWRDCSIGHEIFLEVISPILDSNEQQQTITSFTAHEIYKELDGCLVNCFSYYAAFLLEGYFSI